jgi:hypothetical protein
MGYGCRASLYRRWGADDIVCDGYEPDRRKLGGFGCGSVDPAAARAEFLVESVGEHLLPLRLVWESLYVLLPGCEVAWKTVEQWTKARVSEAEVAPSTGGTRTRITRTPARLEVAGWDGRDRPLYRGADILRLARDGEQCRGRRRTRAGRGRLALRQLRDRGSTARREAASPGVAH